MKRVLLFSSIFMMAGAMNAWADACAKDTTYGAIKVETVDENKCVATLDPESTEDVNIPEDVTIDSVVYNRNFVRMWTTTGNSVFTAIFPFSGRIKGVNIAIIDSISNVWGRWQAHAHNDDSKIIVANTPYLIIPEDSSWSFEGVSSLRTYGDISYSLGENSPWEFRGTYSYKKWEEGDSQIGHVYGFAAKEKENVKAGQFVKVKAGAYIKPMRAYLYYNKKALARRGALAKATDDEDLPSTIEVVFKDKNGVIASIHRMDPVTGAITPVEGWYDMKGRKLDKKPTLPGTYFNNGEKVIIK